MLLQPGATELGAMQALLEARGTGLEPPAGWTGWRAIEVENERAATGPARR